MDYHVTIMWLINHNYYLPALAGTRSLALLVAIKGRSRKLLGELKSVLLTDNYCQGLVLCGGGFFLGVCGPGTMVLYEGN